MPKLKKHAVRDGLLHRVKKHRLKYITILPSLVTILNGVCGFTAIVFATKGSIPGAEYLSSDGQGALVVLGQRTYLAAAGYLIFLAMFADMLDGRLARMSQSTSSFGGQLDSLCDMISFGVAPAFLMLKILEYKLAGFLEYNSALSSFLNRFVWLAAAAYISCAAIRLARFNVENEEDESAHMSFAGLPTPAAAGVVASLIIFQQETMVELYSHNKSLYLVLENIIIYALPFVVLGLSVLMISRIRYAHVLNQNLKGKKPFGLLIRALILLGLLYLLRQTALVVIFCGFALGGFVKWLYYKVKGSRFAIGREISTSEVIEDL
ncbi:MAG: CDP-alcohol phosphatidyltransferase family protein [Planctomycetota bacterium]|jgi:CDP-diacylglycerol--serine O-phosphatidyltransferase